MKKCIVLMSVLATLTLLSGCFQGDPGAAGAQGAAGAAGDIGPSGPQGSQGDVGPQGPAGVDGASCSVAEATDPDTGLDGALITCGNTTTYVDNGANGADGTNGTNGTDGTNGTNGTDGATGATGDTGATGATGATGDTGAAGQPGTVVTNVLLCTGTSDYGLCINSALYSVLSPGNSHAILEKIAVGSHPSGSTGLSCSFTVGSNGCSVTQN